MEVAGPIPVCPFQVKDRVVSRLNGLRGRVVRVNRRKGIVRVDWGLGRRDARGKRAVAANLADVPAATLAFEPGSFRHPAPAKAPGKKGDEEDDG